MQPLQSALAAKAWQASTSAARAKGDGVVSGLLKRFQKDASGATAIEYGLIAAGIAIAIIGAVQGVGTQLQTNFNTITTKLTP